MVANLVFRCCNRWLECRAALALHPQPGIRIFIIVAASLYIDNRSSNIVDNIND